MSEFTLHTGSTGDQTTINVDWFDENNVRWKAKVEIRVAEKDKPRTLEILVDGVVVAMSFGPEMYFQDPAR